MPNTFIALAQTTLTATAASVSFTSISQDYTDLMVYFAIRTTRTADGPGYFALQFNDSSASYRLQAFYTNMGDSPYGAGSQVDTSADGYISFSANHDGSTTNVYGNGYFYLGQYKSDKPKLLGSMSVAEGNTTSNAGRGFYARRWDNTAAITKFTFSAPGSNLKANSSIFIYGIKNS